jgi:hypothetical protein
MDGETTRRAFLQGGTLATAGLVAGRVADGGPGPPNTATPGTASPVSTHATIRATAGRSAARPTAENSCRTTHAPMN